MLIYPKLLRISALAALLAMPLALHAQDHDAESAAAEYGNGRGAAEVVGQMHLLECIGLPRENWQPG